MQILPQTLAYTAGGRGSRDAAPTPPKKLKNTDFVDKMISKVYVYTLQPN
jgi:hypothetical protein